MTPIIIGIVGGLAVGFAVGYLLGLKANVLDWREEDPAPYVGVTVDVMTRGVMILPVAPGGKIRKYERVMIAANNRIAEWHHEAVGGWVGAALADSEPSDEYGEVCKVYIDTYQV